MEKENEKKCSNDKQTGKTALSRRSSILKPPKVQNEENTFRSTRRVSFSSNFIKAFATDEHKNTIWDTTVEEALSGTESSHSQNMQDKDLNVTIIDDKVINLSSDEEIEDTFLDVKKRNLQFSQKQFYSISDEADISEAMEMTGRSQIFTTDPTPHTDIGDNTTTMDLTCINRTLNPSLSEPSNITDISECMEFTCRNQNLTADPSKHRNVANSSATMDFTCLNPTLQAKTSEPLNQADISGEMEFTCRNPTYPTITENPSNHRNVPDNSTTMEFTCVNPTPKPDPYNHINVADTSATMEFTCVNPTLKPNLLNQSSIPGNSNTMEFTCMNPISKANPTNHMNEADNSATMEFTCMNPTLKPDTANHRSIPDHSNHMNEADNLATIEFTCMNPTLKADPSNQRSIPDPTNHMNEADNSPTMEFTCMNPTLKPDPSNHRSIPGNLTTMELTCMNPPKPNHSNHTNVADNSTTMEFTCVNPTLKPDSSNYRNEADDSATMEFTCVNPTLKPNPSNHMTVADQSATMEFTCINPTLKPKASEPPNVSDMSAAMEFTCRNPTLTENPSKLRGVADVSTTMEFTCMNPILKPKASEPLNEADISETMEFTCRNPTLTENSSKQRNVADNSTTMEFTCMNPILKPKASEPLNEADISEAMEFTCRNPTLKENSAKRRNIADNSATMEFTCMNPTLKPNASQPLKVVDNPGTTGSISWISTITNNINTSKRRNFVEGSTSMEFTCENPTLKPSYIDETNISTKFKKWQDPSAEQEFHNFGNETNTAEFPLRKFLDRTNISNISGLDYSKGLSLIQNVDQTTQPLSNKSLAFEIGEPGVDLPVLNLPDITLPTMQMSHLLENVSTLPVADISRHQRSNTSLFIEKGPTIDLPSLNLLDNTSLTSQNISTVPVSNPSHQPFSDVPAVDLPPLNLKGNATASIYVTDIFTNSVRNTSHPGHDREELSELQTENSLTKTMDSLSKSNINLSTSSFGNADDTQQLLRDASRLNRTRNITCNDDSLNSTSDIQMDKTYLVKRKEKSKEDDKDTVQATQADNTDRTYLVKSKEKSLISRECNERQTVQAESTRLEDCTYEKIGASSKNTKGENKIRGDISCEETKSYSNEEKQSEEHMDLFSKCGAGFPEDNYILAEETLELSANGTDQLEICTNLGQEDKNSFRKDHPEEIRGDVCMEQGTERETSEPASGSHKHMGSIKSWEDLQFPPLEDNWKHKMAELDARIERLKEESAGYNRNILKNFELFKKRLDHAIETCQNNRFVPEEVSQDDVVDNDDELDKVLHDKNGILEKIEKKSKICDDSWKMIKVEDGVAKFTTFFQQLEVTLEYSPHDYKVNKIETRSLLTAKARPIAFIMQKEILRLLSPPHINNYIGLHYNILSLLDYIQMVMEKIRKCYTTLKDLEKLYDLKFSNEHKASFMLLNENLVFIWDFTVDLMDLENITVSVNARTGEVDAKHVLKLASECPRGLEFLNSYIIKIKEYIEMLMKRGGLYGLKKCDKVNN